MSARPEAPSPPRLSGGELVRTTSRVVSACFADFSLVTVLALAPALFLVLAFPQLALIGQILVPVAAWVAQSVLTRMTMDHLDGRSSTARQVVSTALARLPSVALASILTGIATCVGFALVIIPGFLVCTTWFVAVQAATVERLDPLAALRRSSELTRGHRTAILAGLLGVLVAPLVVACCTCVVPGGALLTADEGEAPGPAVETWTIAGWFLIRVVLVVVISTFATVVYHRARAFRERIDPDAAAAIFS